MHSYLLTSIKDCLCKLEDKSTFAKLSKKILSLCGVFSIFGCQDAIALDHLPAIDSKNRIEFLAGIHQIVDDALETFHVPGAAIGIIMDDKIVMARGFGIRNLDQNLPVTEYTIFRLASCTKAFTAFILGQLVDEGKLSFDDLVVDYVPEFRFLHEKIAKKATIRDLLAHRTGMARHDVIWHLLEISRSDVLGILHYLDPACELRQEFQYNNFMYAVAGMVIEKVTGQTWEEAVSSRIFIPLDMEASTADLDQMQKSPDHSQPYAEVDNKITHIPFGNMTAVNPGAGINSCLSDILKWVHLQLCQGSAGGRNLIQEETLHEMHTVQMPFPLTVKNDMEIEVKGYGLGWFMGSYRDHAYISHGGLAAGFCAEVAFFSQEKIGLVILTNSSSDGQYFVTAVRNHLFDQLLGLSATDWKKLTLEQREKAKRALARQLDEFNKICQREMLPCPLTEYVGRFEHPAYGVVELNIDDGHLVFTYGNAVISLYQQNEHVFTGQFKELLMYGINPVVDFTFSRNSIGQIDKLEIPFEGFRSAKPIIFMRK